MSAPLEVIKFGSSILRDDADLGRAVAEVYARVRAGSKVVVVTSAFGTRTDDLIARARRLGCADEHRQAELVACGEREALAVLALALDASGLAVAALDERQIGLLTEGPVRSATPVAVDAQQVLLALRAVDVVVVPGFVGRDDRHRPTLLGRGGSDLTAVFLAHRLQAADCVLMKDVDGWFDGDPARHSTARRFARLSFADALRRDDPIVQPRAVRLAAALDRPFRIAGLAPSMGTQVGAADSQYADPPAHMPGLVRVACVGAGAVGLAVIQALLLRAERYQIVAVVVRHADKPRAAELAALPVTTDIDAAFAARPDIIVESIGGVEPARTIVERALRRGVNVVSANKAMLAVHGEALAAMALHYGVSLGTSAAVGGAVPMLEAVQRARQAGVVELRGVLNGTSGFVIDRVSGGALPGDALALARERGLCELDAGADLNGSDAACKLVLLARAAGVPAGPADVAIAGVESLLCGSSMALIAGATRLIATLRFGEAGPHLSVAPTTLTTFDELAPYVSGERCALAIRTRRGIGVVHGRGAGGRPTAQAVFADIAAAAGRCLADPSPLRRPVATAEVVR